MECPRMPASIQCKLTAVQEPSPPQLRILSALLRFGGVVVIMAFPTLLLPAEWMAAAHQWLGLGELPRAPIVEYLARSASALYGFHGVLLLIVAGDPQRYRPIVRYLAVMNILLGGMLLAIDLHAGMPTWWTLAEGPGIIALGVMLAWLLRSVPPPVPTASDRVGLGRND